MTKQTMSRCRTAGLTLLALAVWPALASAQSYTVTTRPTSYSSIQGGSGTMVVLDGGAGTFNDVETSVSLPFPFVFYGQTYNSCLVSTNGYLTFDGAGSGMDATNDNIPDAATPNNYIAPCWDDLQVQANGVTDQILSQLSGSAPNRIFTIEFYSMSIASQGTSSHWVYGQVRLLEGTNVIEFRYRANSFPAGSVTATIGIENGTGTSGEGGPNTMNNNMTLPTNDIVFTPAAQADLTAPTVSATPGMVAQGGTLSVDRTLTNSGGANAGGFSYEVYLSTDNTITTADDLVFTGMVSGGINMGASDMGTDMVTIPVTQTPGPYFVGVIVDSTNAIAEGDENNNTGVTTGTITVDPNTSFPDLSVPTVDALSALVFPGGTFQVSRDIANGGMGDATGFDYGIYLSTDSTITTADDLVFTGNPGTITAGNNNTATVTVTVPAMQALGDYFVGIIVDAGNALAESDENNNTGVDATRITVSNMPVVDLQVSSVTLGTTTIGAGGNVDVTRDLLNSGSANATAFDYGVYLSTDSTITVADTLLFTFTSGGLNTGASDSATVTVNIPSNTALGSYFVGVIADLNGAIAEADESNNATAAATQLTVTNAPVTGGGGKRDTGACALGTPEAPASPWSALALLAIVGGLAWGRRRD